MAQRTMNEQEQFLKGLGDDQTKTVDILEQPFEESKTPEKEKEESEGATGEEEDDDAEGLKPKNRRERRLVKKLQDERESSIFLAGKLEARTEAEKSLASEESDYIKGIERIYGTDTPEAQLATDLLKKAIVGSREDAKRSAIEEWRAERKREADAVAAASQELDNVLEDIEDTYDVTLTSAQQTSFFQLLQKMSPKDRNGNVTDYADPHAVWEVFQEKLSKRGTDNRAKNLSARSMVQSGASKESTLQDDSHTRFLKENGII